MTLPTQGLRLNLGAGDTVLPGFIPLDRKNGHEIYPLAYDDASVDEVRASHCLEHFSHTQIGAVLADWVRVLKPGGLLKIAVPDFEAIARAYLDGSALPVQGYIMGGHVDADDHHGALFDAEELTNALRAAGLLDVRRWTSEINDCAALPISLNLQGRKPAVIPKWTIGAAMSTPRLGFMDNFFCAFRALIPHKIKLRKVTGAYWGQCLERCIDDWLASDVDWILTLDYDSVFDPETVGQLVQLAALHPEADAIAPIQASRTRNAPLMTVRGEDGKNVSQVPLEDMRGDLMRVHTAHFGLTLLRASAIRELSRPLFHGVPGSNGTWDDERIDDDIYFWKQWEKAGKSLYLANHVVIGHAELMVLWPDQNFHSMYQHPSDYFEKGRPPESWQ